MFISIYILIKSGSNPDMDTITLQKKNINIITNYAVKFAVIYLNLYLMGCIKTIYKSNNSKSCIYCLINIVRGKLYRKCC